MRLSIAVILVFAFALHANAQESKSIYVDPACPKPGEVVTLRAMVDGAAQMVAGPLTVNRDGATFKLVLPIVNVTFNEVPPQYGLVDVGQLPLGTYVVELYTRERRSATVLGPELFVTRTTFVVQQDPPACEARRIVPVSNGFVRGFIGQPYETALAVRVVDAHGYPVPNARVHWYRMPPPGEPAVLPQRPDVTKIAEGTTDADGIYSVQTTANNVTGTFQYRAFILYVEQQPSVYFVVNNRSSPSSDLVYPVIEYYNGDLLHFFMTSNPAEMLKLDAEGSGWWRSGGVFLAYSADASARPAQAVSVCRFYGLPSAGLDSHFFSASAQECQDVQLRFGSSWMLETDNAFGVLLPDTRSGACPPGSIPVHRLYNNRPDANHRYGVGALALLAPSYFTATGPWIPEGYGPDAVVMCSPE